MAKATGRAWRKGLLTGGLFLLLVGGTVFLLGKDLSPDRLTAALGQAKIPWLLAGVGCMLLFFCCEAKNLQRGLALFGAPTPYRFCLRYGVIGFFFSSVTPSASGGQPMQLYAMVRQGHPPAVGAMALLTEFFSFQLAALTLAAGGFLLHRQILLTLPQGVLACFFVGAGLNLLTVLLLIGMVTSPRLLPALWQGFMVPARRLFPKKAARWETWGLGQLEDLHRCVRLCRGHGRALIKNFLTSLVQAAAYHSIPFWVYCALGLQGESLWSLAGLQAVLFLSVSSLPLPGAVGLTEGGFLLLYQGIFPKTLLPGAMVLSRGVSFYLFLTLSGLYVALGLLLSLRPVRPELPAQNG